MLVSVFHQHLLTRKKTPNVNLNFPARFFSSKPYFSTVSFSMAEHAKKKKMKKTKMEMREDERLCESDIEDFSMEETLKIRVSLLDWYYQNQRILPWRVNQHDEEEEEDRGKGKEGSENRAYAVWVSEVMLQQTRVTTVIDYYNRWMEKWPTVHHLAQASQEEVNEMWAGLGYYRRARFLLEGAQSIAEGGEFPKMVSALREVRGIGDYTAGAIASIAFKEAVPVVDGNVIRVIARLKAISANPKDRTTSKSFWKLVGQLVDPSRPGDFNQALMELGATICTPTSPGCSSCPISDQCHALSVSGKSVRVTDFPMKVEKAKQRLDFVAVCVIEMSEGWDLETWKKSHKSNLYLLIKRPEDGLLAGLWEFPSVPLEGEEGDSSVRRKVMDQHLKKSFKLDMKKNSKVLLREDVGEFVHVFTHIRRRMYVELMVINLKEGANDLYSRKDQNSFFQKFVDHESIQSMGLTSGVRKVYNMIQVFKQNKQSINPTKATSKKTSEKLSAAS